MLKVYFQATSREFIAQDRKNNLHSFSSSFSRINTQLWSAN